MIGGAGGVGRGCDARAFAIPGARGWLVAAVLATLAGAPLAAQQQSTGRPKGPTTVTGALVQLQQRREMPNVIDSTESVARAMLSPFKPTVIVKTRDTSSAALDGRVFSQSPEPRIRLPLANATVALGVFRYVPAETVTVPDVIGRSVALAVRLLQRERLTPNVPLATGMTINISTVADQSPKGGMKASAGDTVTLIVDVTMEVPSVVGLDVPTATRILTVRGLVVAPQGSDYSDRIAAGRVARQHPDSGTTVRPGERVSIWTSLGAHPPAPVITMPRLTGLTLAQASAVLRLLQLQVTHVDSVIDGRRAGRIVLQRPEQGDSVHPRDPVDLTVALAPIDHGVPWVVGMPWQRAVARLEDSSFVASLRFAALAGVAPGIVTRQGIDSGERRPPNTAVLLTVADTAGPPLPTSQLMPDVVGRPRADAVASLGFLSPRITIVEQVVTTRADDGLVTGQEPQAREVVFPPVRVVLQVGRFQPPPVPDSAARDSMPQDSAVVPDLVGRPLREARQRLAQARLALGEVTGEDVGVDSIVDRHIPAAGVPTAFGVAVSVVLRTQRVPVQDSLRGLQALVKVIMPLWPFLVLAGGVFAGFWLVRNRHLRGDAGTSTRPPDDPVRRDERPRAADHVVLRPSPASPPVVELPPGESLLENEVSLIDLAPDVEIDAPGTLIAREEEHDGR